MHDAEAIGALTAKVDELARACARLSQENAELRSQVSALSAESTPTDRAPSGQGPAAVNKSTGPGVHGTSGSGRGGIFAGGAAQIQLTPGAKSHPASGQRGDLYADASGRLWY